MRFKLWRRVMRPEAGVVLNRMPDVRRRTPARSIGPKLRSDAALAAQAVRVVALGGGTGRSPLPPGLNEHVARRRLEAGGPPTAHLGAVVGHNPDGCRYGRL